MSIYKLSLILLNFFRTLNFLNFKKLSDVFKFDEIRFIFKHFLNLVNLRFWKMSHQYSTEQSKLKYIYMQLKYKVLNQVLSYILNNYVKLKKFLHNCFADFKAVATTQLKLFYMSQDKQKFTKWISNFIIIATKS